METYITKILASLKDKWPLVIACCVCVVLVIFAYGCEPETASLIHPLTKVTRAELNIEIETLLSTSQIRFADLDRQEQIRDVIFQQALVIAEGGAINPFGIITTLLAVLGVGAAADDVRLRKERKRTLTYTPNT